jgi:hypothetical protein
MPRFVEADGMVRLGWHVFSEGFDPSTWVVVTKIRSEGRFGGATKSFNFPG